MNVAVIEIKEYVLFLAEATHSYVKTGSKRGSYVNIMYCIISSDFSIFSLQGPEANAVTCSCVRSFSIF